MAPRHMASLRNRPWSPVMLESTLVIGIAGGSGSGKTTLADHLLNGPFGAQICRLTHDSYYRNFDQLPRLPDGSGNWDHPDSLDNQLFLRHAEMLRMGHPVPRPIYNFANHERQAETVALQPNRILLLEGILLLAIPEIRDHIDLRIYVDTPADLRILRRTLRDIDERGRSARSVAEQYQQTVRPMHEAFVEPSRYHAHIWIPWLSHNQPALDLLNSRIAQALNTR